MKKKVGIRFKAAGKVYDFDCGAFVLNNGDHVIVDYDPDLEGESKLTFVKVEHAPIPVELPLGSEQNAASGDE